MVVGIGWGGEVHVRRRARRANRSTGRASRRTFLASRDGSRRRGRRGAPMQATMVAARRAGSSMATTAARSTCGLARADTVILLDIGRIRCVWRVLKRTARNLGHGADGGRMPRSIRVVVRSRSGCGPTASAAGRRTLDAIERASRRGRLRAFAHATGRARLPRQAWAHQANRSTTGRVVEMAIRKICGVETEYGIVLRGAGDSNPIAASSMLINAYVNELARERGGRLERAEGGLGLRGRVARQRRTRLAQPGARWRPRSRRTSSTRC